MRTIDILSPVSLGALEARPVTAAPESLAGKRLGLRGDRAWRSLQWFAEEIATFATEHCGVDRVVFFDPETRIGSPDTERDKIRRFAEGVDVAVVGLGT
jgi:hypothetical protein